MAREQRRLAAIVAADVVGYSRLMGRDESGTLAALKGLRRDVVNPPITVHGGRIVKSTGDGLLLDFPSVVDAVRCVVDVQTAMASKGADIPDDRRIAFRIGVNLGDIIIDDDDIFGDGINIGARLQKIASPAGIYIEPLNDDVRDRLDIAFEDGGPQTLKNIARPVIVWRWSPGVPSDADRDRACHRSAAGAPRQAVNRGVGLCQHERRSRAGVLHRRHHRGHHHRALTLPVTVRDRPQLVVLL